MRSEEANLPEEDHILYTRDWRIDIYHRVVEVVVFDSLLWFSKALYSLVDIRHV
jgi:hypothetical protein